MESQPPAQPPRPPQPLPDLPDSLAKRFKVIGILGTGGYAIVYRALDLVLGRDVALKTLRDDVIGPAAIEELLKEARALAALDEHDNIIRIHEVERAGGSVWLVLEYAPGGSLHDRIARCRLSTLEAVKVGCEAAAGLGYAHTSKGGPFVHRDVKPRNLLLGGDGEIRVADFGLARFVPANESTGFGRVRGTIPYMSPEQTIYERVDPPSDQFSLCVSLFQAVTGKLPFSSGSEGLMAAIRSREPAWPVGADSIDSGLRAVLAHGLEKDPGRRYPDMFALAEDLAGVGRPRAIRSVPSVRSRFVGRSAELARLVELTSAIVEPGGRGTTVFVAGVLGMGKRSLLDAFLQSETTADLVRGQVRRRFRDGRRGLEPIADALYRLLGEAVPVVPAQDGIARESLDDRLGELVGRLATIGPFVLALEELQEAGPDALRTLRRLQAAMPRTRGLLMLTYRPEAVGPGHSGLGEHVDWSLAEQLAERIDLRPFADHEIAQLVELELGVARADRGLVEALRRNADGVPLFLYHSLLHLVKTGVIDADGHVEADALDGVVPEVIRNILRYRLRQVDPALRDVLRAAAVVGTVFDTTVLSKLMPMPQLQVVAKLQVLVAQHHIIEPTGERYCFSHVKFRDIILQDPEWLLPEFARHMHDRLATILIAEFPARVDAIADHLVSGGRRAAALPYQAAAAKLADDQGESLEARRRFEELAANLSAQGAETSAEFLSVYVDLGRLRLRGADNDLARSAFAHVLQHAPIESRARGLACYNLGALALGQGNPAEAKSWFEQAAEALARVGDAIWEAAARDALGSVLRREGRLDDALSEFEAGLALRQMRGYQPGIARSLNSMGNIYFVMGEFARTLTAFEQAVRLMTAHARVTGDRVDLARFIDNQGFALVRIGRPEAGLEAGGRAFALRRELGDRNGEVASLLNLAEAQVVLGLHDLGRQSAEEARELARKLNYPAAEVHAVVLLARASRSSGLDRLVPEELEQALEQAEQGGDAGPLVKCRIELAAFDRANGDFPRAHDRLTEAERIRAEAGLDELQATLLLERARLAIAAGNPSLARDCLRQGLEVLGKRPEPEIAWRMKLALSRLVSDGASQLRAEACAIVRTIADGILDASLRASYLADPERAALLGDERTTG